MAKFIEFLNDESGATAIEYGLIAALMSTVIVVGITAVGDSTNTMYNALTNTIIQ